MEMMRGKWRVIVVGIGLAVALAMIPVGVYAATQTFGDVPESDWAFDDVEWLAAKGLTNGCGDGSIFCPDGNVTRREIAAFTHRQELLLGTRIAAAWSQDVAVPDDTDTLLASGYITVPTAGGFVSAIASVGFDGGDAYQQYGWVWLEANNGGACDGSNVIASSAAYDTYLIQFETITALGGFEGLVGEKRVDVCAWGIGTATAWTTELQLTWVAAGAEGGDFVVPASPATSGADLEQRKEILRHRGTP